MERIRFSATVGDNKPNGSAGAGSAEGSQESVTRAGVSGGAIVITDGAAQQALTGKSVEEVLASLDRDVTSETVDASALLKAWDAARLQKEVNAQVKITAEFGKAASKAAGEYATRKAVEARTLKNEEEALKWDEGGEYRIALHGGIGPLTGGVQGAAGALTSAKLMPMLGEEIAGMNLPKPVSDALIMAAGAGLGAAAGGGTGAAAGLNETANNYLSRSPFASVRRMISLENARLTNACGDNCTQEIFAKNDALLVKMEASATKIAAVENSPFQPVTQEEAEALSQTVLEMMPVYGSIESTLQLLTGKSSLTGEDVNRYVAALGLIPFSGTIRKAGLHLQACLVLQKNARVVAEPVYKTIREAVVAAKALGFFSINELSHGQAVFKKDGMFITRDTEGHIGGAWKGAKSIQDLASKETRGGTFDINLVRIGD